MRYSNLLGAIISFLLLILIIPAAIFVITLSLIFYVLQILIFIWKKAVWPILKKSWEITIIAFASLFVLWCGLFIGFWSKTKVIQYSYCPFTKISTTEAIHNSTPITADFIPGTMMIKTIHLPDPRFFRLEQIIEAKLKYRPIIKRVPQFWRITVSSSTNRVYDKTVHVLPDIVNLERSNTLVETPVPLSDAQKMVENKFKDYYFNNTNYTILKSTKGIVVPSGYRFQIDAVDKHGELIAVKDQPCIRITYDTSISSYAYGITQGVLSSATERILKYIFP